MKLIDNIRIYYLELYLFTVFLAWTYLIALGYSIGGNSNIAASIFLGLIAAFSWPIWVTVLLWIYFFF